MGVSLNICDLLVRFGALARCTISCCTVPRRKGWVNWLGGAGILALIFSVVSPDDDAFQQELIRTTPASANVSSQTRIAQRGPLADLSINAFAAAGDPIRALRASRLVVMDQRFNRLTYFQAPISIHSPPALQMC